MANPHVTRTRGWPSRWMMPPRTDLLALGYAAIAAASVGLFGFTLPSVGIPAALLLALVADGIVRPGSNLFYPSYSRGSRTGRSVALTFDDGPDPEVTPRVLDVLAQYGARATFFTIGCLLAAHPQLARRLKEEHHELGNHSWTHSRQQSFFRARRQQLEIERCAQAIGALTGSRAAGPAQPLFRPPFGLRTPPLVLTAWRMQLTLVSWSLHSHDTRTRDPQRIAQRVLEKIRPGDIVLLHDGHDVPGRHRSACAQALPRILQGLHEKGLQCVTVTELLRASEAVT